MRGHTVGFDPSPIAARIPDNPMEAAHQLQRISLTDGGADPITGEAVAASPEVLAFDPAYAVRVISDLVPNPFVGRELVGGVLEGLHARGFDAAARA